MSRFLPDLSPLFKVIERIAIALEGIDQSLDKIVEMAERPKPNTGAR